MNTKERHRENMDMKNIIYASAAEIFSRDETGTFFTVKYRCPKCNTMNEQILFSDSFIEGKGDFIVSDVDCLCCDSKADIVFTPTIAAEAVL